MPGSFYILKSFLQNTILKISLLKRRDWIRLIAISAGLFFASLVLTTAFVYVQYQSDKDGIRRNLRSYHLWLEGKDNFPVKQPILIYSNDGRLMGRYFHEDSSRMTLAECRQMKWMNRAAVSAEDSDFYSHSGLNFRGIFRAVLNNLFLVFPGQGGGSITQQLARNLYTSRRSPVVFRKIYETFAAFQIEEQLSKEEILCIYLNKIYMGEGNYGVVDASNYYFRKSPGNLSAAEAAMIAGLFPSPVRYSPLNSISRSLQKQKAVLNAMERDGHLKKNEPEILLQNFMSLYGVTDAKDSGSGSIGIYGSNRYFKSNIAPDVNEYVRHFLDKYYVNSGNIPEGIRVYTTIDLDRQKAAMNSVRSSVMQIRKKIAAGSPFPPVKTEEILHAFNGVFLSLYPSDGRILAMVGGFKTPEDENTDRVWHMKRQPGSAIKGFLYALALEEGLIESSGTVLDENINYYGYSPVNWYGSYLGEISVSEAVARSVNTIPVKLLKKMGVSYFKKKLDKAADISSSRYDSNLSLALGSGELSPVELARIYSILANSGYKIYPYLIEKIEDKDGNVIDTFGPNGSREEVLSSDSAGKAVNLLRSPIENEKGTARFIGKQKESLGMKWPAAVKTGTVETDPIVRKKFRNMKGIHDAWFVAIVPGEVDVLWFGNDLGVPFSGGGASTAGSAWLQYAAEVLKNKIKNSDNFIFQNENFQSVDGSEGIPEIIIDSSPEINTDSKKSDEIQIVIPDEKPVG